MKKIIYLLFALLAFQCLKAQSILPPDTVPYLLPDSVVPTQDPAGPINYVGGGHDVALFAGGTNQFEAQTSAISYSWSPTTGLSDSTISNPYVTVNTTTTYTVRIQTSTDTNYYTVRAIVITPAPTSDPSCTNWVPNGDFESAAGCTSTVSNLNWQTNWANAGGSCDFFTACNTPDVWHSWWFVVFSNFYVTYPSNCFGNQTSSGHGNSYAGLITTSFDTQFPWFEYTQTELACSLITGQRYHMQFDASWAGNSNFSCGNIGMLVTTNTIQANPWGTQIVASPQVDGSCGTNTSWTTYTNTYTGTGEKYVTIGDFDLNPASQNVCPRINNNMLPEFPLSSVHPALDFTYDFLDNIIIYPIAPDVSATYTLNCAGLGTPPTNQNNILTEIGSPGNLCSWFGPGGAFLGTGASIPITTPNTPGTYIYTVSVDLSAKCTLCTAPLTNTISIQVLPLTPGATLTPVAISPVCADYHTGLGTVNGHVTGAPVGTHYIWDPVLIPSGGYGNTGHFSLPPGVYTVNVTTGNCSGLGTTTFTINPFPVFTLTTSDTSICYGVNTATLTASDPSFNYSWTPVTAPFGLSATTGSVVVANPTAGSIYATNHVYTANTVNSFGCVASHTISVKSAKPPIIQLAKVTNGGLCSDSHSTWTLTANGTGAGTNGTDVWSPSGITATSITVNPTTTTVYTLTETTEAGCTASGTATLTVNPTPTVSIVASATSVCAGSSPTFTVYATPTNSTTVYSWGAGFSSSNVYTPPHVGTSVTNHTYTVTVKTDGCQATATININYTPIPVKPTFGGSICSGVTSVLTVTNSVGGETYSWAAPAGGSVSCNNAPTCNSETIINAIAGGVYSVTATDANGCVSPTATIIPKNSPIVSISHTSHVINCENAPNSFNLNGLITPSGGTSSPNTYNWSTGATTNSISVTPSVTTTYTLIGTSGATGCTNTATVEINVTPNPTITAVSSPVCTGSTATLTASAMPVGTTNYTWVGTGVGSNAHSNPLITTVINAPRTYTVSAVVNTCPSNTITITLIPLARPIISAIASPTTICQGSSSVLTASGANTYTWTSSTFLNTNIGNPVTATPSVTTNYGVQGTDANGCLSLSAPVRVTVIPTTTLNVTAPNYTICQGSSVNLTAHGSANYTWTPDPSLSATTGSVVTATPSVTSVYTVVATSTLGCNSVGTITINVTPAPSLTLTALANPICTGMNTTLTASGATTYTWVSGPGLGINSTNNHSVTITTPNLTGSVTYTVNGTVGTCKGSAVLTVTVNPPPDIIISVSSVGSNCSSTSTVICVGDPVIMGASSSTAISYTWDPGVSTDNPITVTPTGIGNNIYTVTASDGLCTSTATTNVVVTNCTATLTRLPNAGTFTSGNFYVPSSFTCGNLSLTGCNVSVAPGATITVPNNVTLTINNTHINAVSNSMWQGIVVLPGATINVSNNAMIEDAVVAIDNGGSTANVLTGLPSKVLINGAIFNCNRTAIRQAYYQTNNPAFYGLSNFSVQGSVVTCRCGISQAAGVAPLQLYTNSTGVATTISNPTIDDYYSVGNYTSANLKYPYQGTPAYEGVHLENSGFFGNSNPTLYAFNVGASKQNVFDNLTYGINAINATFSVTTTAFQLPRKSGTGGLFPLFIIGGYGINCTNTIPDWYNGIYVKNSQFIRMVRGIQSINYYDINVNANRMFSQQVIIPISPATPINPPQGDYGMYFKTPRFKNASMSNNQIANINTCIDFVIDQNTSYNGGNGEYVGAVTVNTNTIVNQFPTTSYATTYIGNGIIVDNVIVPTGATTLTPVTGVSTEISVRNNTITKAYRGVLVRNQEYQVARTENNSISMQLEPTATSTITTQYGIEHNRVGYDPTAGLYPTITTNTVTGFITPADYSNLTYFEPKKGIWANQTVGHYVTCNNVTNAGRAMEFTGSNQKMIWRLNQMNTSGEGFILSAATGGGVIGTQGAIGDGIDNTWSGFSGVNPETFVDIGSNAINSILYIQNLTGYVPLNNFGTGNYNNFPSSNLINSGSPSTTYDCSTVIAGRMANSNQVNVVSSNARNVSSGQTNSTSSISSDDIALMEMIVQDSLPYMGDSAQNSFINKTIVYRALKQDTTQMSGSAILQNFYAASQTTCRQLFCLIEDSLHQGGYTFASGLVNGFTPSCTIEQNYKRFYQIYINAQQGVATNADTVDLESLASSCPLLNGSVVFQARAFHNSWYNDFKNYEDNCPQGDKADNNRKTNTATSVTVDKKLTLSLYPNPSNGMIYISASDGASHAYNAEVRDLGGKLLYKQNLVLENGSGRLKLNADNGAYMLYLYNNDGTATAVFKIIIAN